MEHNQVCGEDRTFPGIIEVEAGYLHVGLCHKSVGVLKLVHGRAQLEIVDPISTLISFN
jgi:hypothetical protein